MGFTSKLCILDLTVSRISASTTLTEVSLLLDHHRNILTSFPVPSPLGPFQTVLTQQPDGPTETIIQIKSLYYLKLFEIFVLQLK